MIIRSFGQRLYWRGMQIESSLLLLNYLHLAVDLSMNHSVLCCFNQLAQVTHWDGSRRFSFKTKY